MSEKHAILIGVESVDGLAPTPFAGDELRAFARTLEGVGFTRDRQTILTGVAATRTAADSRLRKVARSLSAGDEVWVVFAGPAFVEDRRGFLACADTLDDDRAATSLGVADLIGALNATGATVRVWLDAPGLNDDELSDLLPADGRGVALTAAESGQPSHAAAGRRLWLQLVGDALAGRAAAALTDGELTAEGLREWAAQELPRLVRKAMAKPTAQQPQVFGPGSAVLAHVTAVDPPATARLDRKQLKRIVFRGERRGKVKDLAGFQKSFKLPDSATPSAQKWTYRLAADNLRAAVEETYGALREHLGFKRKDLESTVGGDGVGVIRTPGFDVTISVSLDPDDPTGVIWRREVSQISDAAILRSDGFRQVFGSALDTLQFDFETAIDVEDLVDRIEDDPPPGVAIRVASDGSSCDVTVAGFAGRIHVERASLRVEGPASPTPDSLVEQFFAFQTRFGKKKGRRALKG